MLLAVTLTLALVQSATTSPPPSSTPDERARWRSVLRWPDECEAAHRAATKALDSQDGRVRVFDLGGRRALVEVGCTRGAYQDGLLFYLDDQGRTPPRATPPRATPLSVPGYAFNEEEDEWQPQALTVVAGEAWFDASRKVLRIFSRARGLGDCGSIARYRVQGVKLVLLDFRGRACDGDPEDAPPPDKWPRLFPK